MKVSLTNRLWNKYRFKVEKTGLMTENIVVIKD